MALSKNDPRPDEHPPPTLAEFLLARLDEDEREGQLAWSKADGHLWVVTGPDNAVGVDYDPARVLAEVAAHRRIVDEHHISAPYCAVCADPPAYEATWREYPCLTLRLLALPHAAHESYNPEWAP